MVVNQAKKNFERRLATRIREDPKTFYSYVRSKQKVKDEVGPMKKNGK